MDSLATIVADATSLASAINSQAAADDRAGGDGFDLTPREREVLRLLVEGKSDREIAAALFMGPRTVSWHVGHNLAKLDVESRTAAAATALRNGIV
jgi:DNA-binding CsgD family transcriptional regulator